MKSQASIRIWVAVLCVLTLGIAGGGVLSAHASETGGEALLAWQELQRIAGEEVLVTGKQLRAADTGEQYTMFYLPSGEEAPADFIAAHQRRWTVEAVSADSETHPGDSTKEVAAQQVPPALPESGLVVDIVEPNSAALLEEDSKTGADSTPQSLLRIGVAQPALSTLDLATLPPSLWQSLPDGGSALAVGIEAPGAFGQRVHLQDLVLPEGASVLARNAENPAECPEVLTRESLGNATDYWLGTVFSPRVQVEFRVPEGVDPATLSCRITEVSYIYRDPLTGMVQADAMQKLGNCHKDVTCYPDWSSTNKSVARYTFISGGSTYLCTGTLMNDKDTTTWIPYFLTAHHCLSTQTVAGTIEFFWLYQTSSCNGYPPSLSSASRTTGGATLLATLKSNDMTFLRMRNSPPGGLTYAGWTTESPSSAQTMTGIHHPEGSYKRICFGNVVGSDADFWTLRWSAGTTEQGSSGSAVFNPNKQVVGQLLGGNASCSNPNGVDYYGRFNVTYPLVQSWIAGEGTGGVGELKEIHFSNPFFSDLRSSMETEPFDLDTRRFKITLNITKADAAGVTGYVILDGLPIGGRTNAPITGGSVSYNKKYQRVETRFRVSGKDPVSKESFKADCLLYRGGNTLFFDASRSKIEIKLVYPTKKTYKGYIEGWLNLVNSSTTVKVLDLSYSLLDAKKRLYRTSTGYVSLPWGESTAVTYTGSPQTRSERKAKTGGVEHRRKYLIKGAYTRAANIQLESDWYNPDTATSLPLAKYKVQSYRAKGDQKDTSCGLSYKGYPLPAGNAPLPEPATEAKPPRVVFAQ